jgi:hypothetical protein
VSEPDQELADAVSQRTLTIFLAAPDESAFCNVRRAPPEAPGPLCKLQLKRSVESATITITMNRFKDHKKDVQAISYKDDVARVDLGVVVLERFYPIKLTVRQIESSQRTNHAFVLGLHSPIRRTLHIDQIALSKSVEATRCVVGDSEPATVTGLATVSAGEGDQWEQLLHDRKVEFRSVINPRTEARLEDCGKGTILTVVLIAPIEFREDMSWTVLVELPPIKSLDSDLSSWFDFDAKFAIKTTDSDQSELTAADLRQNRMHFLKER